jgi:putative FmdB family regulatory protein
VPTYQYTCTECGEPVEAVQKFSDAPLTVCAACGGRLRKVFSPVGIVFKGSGFYRTDNRGGSKRSTESGKETSKEKESAGAGSSSSTSKSDTKSDSKSGSKSDSKPASKSPEAKSA